MTGRRVEPVSRQRPPEDALERETLTGLLDFLRATVVNKVAGLSDEEAFSAPVPPSTSRQQASSSTSPGVERFWFSIDFAGQDLPWPWPDDDQHGAFAIDPGDSLAGLVEVYLEECERSRKVVADAALDDPARGLDMAFNLRYALAHMIEETARHCGHLDLLRERVDGLTGE